MKNKAVIIIAVIVFIAVGVTVAVLLSNQPSVDGSSDSAVESASSADTDTTGDVTNADIGQAGDTHEPIVVSDTDTVLPDVTLSIRKIVQKDSYEEVAPRVVFGEAYKECYLKLSGDTVELCLNPYTGELDTGTYTYENGVMQVSLGYDRSKECQVILSDDGLLQYIVVEHDGYDCYFG